MNRLSLIRATGILFILMVVLSNIPYTLLTLTFEYDDILREPVSEVLTKFHAGGTQLILIWFAFGLSALLLIPASVLLYRAMALPSRRPKPAYLAIATLMGALSGILQAIGLMRWVFVVPILANLYTAPNVSETTQTAVSVVYQTVHQYGGVILGEHLGQTLLVGWTVGVGLAMQSSPLFKSWVGWWGLATAPLLLLGQSELLATVIPATPVLETTPIGFIWWEVWLLLVGISLLRVPQKRLKAR